MTSVLHEVVESSTNIAPSTKAKYLKDLDAWIAFAGSDPANWTRKKAQAFYAKLIDRIKPQSANRLMASIRFAAKWWAAQEENANLQTFVLVQEAKPDQVAHKQAMSIDQARKLLDACQHPRIDPIDLRDFTLIVIALETGMRRMSLRSMTLEHTYPGADPKYGYPTTHVLMKGSGKSRVPVPLSDTALICLDAYLTTTDIRKGPVFQALARDKTSSRHKLSGEMLSESMINKLVETRSTAAGLKISPHIFRHTFVTWRLDAGYRAPEIASMTGHKLAELGALVEYIDPKVIGVKMRASTPEWLASYVMRRLK